MVLVYAATSDLTTWTGGPPPANATQLLRSASMLITSATVASVYGVDDAGLPSEAKVLQAFKDATCAQVAYWVTAGVDPTGGGISTAAPVRGKRLGSGSVEYDTAVSGSVTAFQAKRAAAATLCAEAFMVLHQAGVTPSGVQRG
ncbi:hypothetical protein [Paenarthrobacter sp. JL.01a]|uniref:hypothetical protein n=1 Tax=Paenarthrobacter sp. JL.01a TaxID=2979324 RepID=UPI0021CA0C11|nr:hypothetical protein [Paenarthrobacter sp. JL.01a]UXM90947.1 hypothetical protein N5P29_16850 [Paenarthrobacter sp. JL.01a]